MPLTVAEIDAAIDDLATGAISHTMPNGTSVTRASLNDLRQLRKDRKAQLEDSEGGIVAQYTEFN